MVLLKPLQGRDVGWVNHQRVKLSCNTCADSPSLACVHACTTLGVEIPNQKTGTVPSHKPTAHLDQRQPPNLSPCIPQNHPQDKTHPYNPQTYLPAPHKATPKTGHIHTSIHTPTFQPMSPRWQPSQYHTPPPLLQHHRYII